MAYKLISLSSSTSRETLSKKTWVKALRLAMTYGWQPMGTQPPSIYRRHGLAPGNWRGSYFKHDGQTVKAEDVVSLRTALERALDDIPDSRYRVEDNLPEWFSPMERAIIEEGIESMLLDILARNPFEYFAGPQKRRLVEFIRFCRSGSFLIL
jgi:hypothetical protein